MESIVARIRQAVEERIREPQNGQEVANASTDYRMQRVSALESHIQADVASSGDRLEVLASEALDRIKQLGEKPPVPNTLRGRFGSVLSNIVKRALWWQSLTVEKALVAENARNREQTLQLAALRGHVLTLVRIAREEQALVSELKRDLAPLANYRREAVEGTVTARTSRIESDSRFRELEASTLELHSRVREMEARDRHSRTDLINKIVLLENTIEALQSTTAHDRESTAVLSEKITAMNSHSGSLEQHVAELQKAIDTTFNTRVVAVEQGVARALGLDTVQTKMNARVDALEQHVAEMQQEIGAARTGLEAVEQRSGDLAHLSPIQERLDSLALVAGRVSEEIRLQQSLDTERQVAMADIRNAGLQQLEKLEGRLAGLGQTVQKQRMELSLQEARISLFLAELRKHPDRIDSDSRLLPGLSQNSPDLDALYVAFQDAFRGTRSEIKNRQVVYLPTVQNSKMGTIQAPVLDLGCGRGEWLEVLRENSLQGMGVDSNLLMVEMCRQTGLNVESGDALAFLCDQPDSSLGGITSFHMIEHIPFDAVLTLLDQALRALKSGGFLILETPNPQNISTGAANFYFDPTHLKPIPSGSLRFFVEARGFTKVSVMELNPYNASVLLPEDALGISHRLNELFYGPQDYAVIAFRP